MIQGVFKGLTFPPHMTEHDFLMTAGDRQEAATEGTLGLIGSLRGTFGLRGLCKHVL